MTVQNASMSRVGIADITNLSTTSKNGRDWLVKAQSDQKFKGALHEFRQVLQNMQQKRVSERGAYLFKAVETFVSSIDKDFQTELQTLLFKKCGCTEVDSTKVREFFGIPSKFVKAGGYHFDKSLNKFIGKIENGSLLTADEKDVMKKLKDEKASLNLSQKTLKETEEQIINSKTKLLEMIAEIFLTLDLQQNEDGSLKYPSTSDAFNEARLQIIEKLKKLQTGVNEESENLSIESITNIPNFASAIDLSCAMKFFQNLDGDIYKLVEGSKSEKGLKQLIRERGQLQTEITEKQKSFALAQKEKLEKYPRLNVVRADFFRDVK